MDREAEWSVAEVNKRSEQLKGSDGMAWGGGDYGAGWGARKESRLRAWRWGEGHRVR